MTTTEKREPFPTMAALELTYGCNHSCLFCSNPWKTKPKSTYPIGKELTTEEWIQMVTRLAKLGVNNFCLTGGEPTLHNGFGKIVRQLLEKTEWFDYVRLRPRPVDVSVLTNGDTDVWIKDEELCSLMATKPKDVAVKSVSVALHGGPERHRQVTGGASIERTLETMRTLVARGVTVFANIVIGGGDGSRDESSAIADAEQAARLAAEAGVFNLVIMRPLATGRAAGEGAKDFVKLSSDAVQRALRAVSRVAAPHGGTVTLACCTPKCVVPDDSEIESLVVPRSCGCGKDTICIDPAGLVRPCTTSDVIGGSAIIATGSGSGPGPGPADATVIVDDDSDPATLAVFSHQIKAFVSSAKKGERPPICQACPHKEECTAGCPSAHVDCVSGGRCDPLVLTVKKAPSIIPVPVAASVAVAPPASETAPSTTSSLATPHSS